MAHLESVAFSSFSFTPSSFYRLFLLPSSDITIPFFPLNTESLSLFSSSAFPSLQISTTSNMGRKPYVLSRSRHLCEYPLSVYYGLKLSWSSVHFILVTTYGVCTNIVRGKLGFREERECVHSHRAKAGMGLPPGSLFLSVPCLLFLLKCMFTLKDLVCLKNSEPAEFTGRNVGDKNGSQVPLVFPGIRHGA